MSDVSAAIIRFSSDNKDEKANMTPMYLSINGTVYLKSFSALNCKFMLSHSSQMMLMQILYYDGPSPPAGLFDDFFVIPSLASSIHEGSFSDFITICSNVLGAFAGFR
jgi:hypothetical protein